MKRWMFPAAVALFFACQAQAADLSLYAGYLNPGGVSLNNLFNNNFLIRGSGTYGGRFEVDFHRFLGLEENIAFAPNLIQPQFFGTGNDVHGFFYHSNLVLNVPLGHMIPFATAGMGLIKPFGPDLRPFGTRFAFNYGGGVKFVHIAGPIGLRFDVRGYSVPDVNTRTLNMIEASGGLIFTFGKE